MVLSSWQSHCESSPGSFDECRLSAKVRVCSPCPRLYIAVAVVINTTACGEIRNWVLSHRSQACYR